MEKLNNLFKDYDNSIKLNESDYNKMREKRNIIIKELKADEKIISFDHLNLGSYKLKTGVKYKDKDYDIDCGIRLNIKVEELENYSAKKCKDDIYSVLYSYRTTSYKNKCITAKYYKEGEPAYHVDFPIFAYDRDLGIYYLAEGKQNETVSWVESKPEDLIEYLNLKDDNYKRIVRILKKWNSKAFENKKKNSKAPSVALTISVKEWFDENTYKNDIDTLIAISKNIKELINNDSIYKQNPFCNDNLYYKMDSDVDCVKIFEEELEKLIKTLVDSKELLALSLYEVCKKLKKVLPDFPEPEKEEVEESFGSNKRYA